MKDEILFKKRNGSSSFYHKFLTQHPTRNIYGFKAVWRTDIVFVTVTCDIYVYIYQHSRGDSPVPPDTETETIKV